MTPERKAFINSLLEHYQQNDALDVQGMLKDLLGDTLQGMLEAEMDQKLGYSKYDYQNKETDDSRKGYSKKRLLLLWVRLLWIFQETGKANSSHTLIMAAHSFNRICLVANLVFIINTSCSVFRDKCETHLSHSTHNYLRFWRWQKVDGIHHLPLASLLDSH